MGARDAVFLSVTTVAAHLCLWCPRGCRAQDITVSCQTAPPVTFPEPECRLISRLFRAWPPRQPHAHTGILRMAAPPTPCAYPSLLRTPGVMVPARFGGARLPGRAGIIAEGHRYPARPLLRPRPPPIRSCLDHQSGSCRGPRQGDAESQQCKSQSHGANDTCCEKLRPYDIQPRAAIKNGLRERHELRRWDNAHYHL